MQNLSSSRCTDLQKRAGEADSVQKWLITGMVSMRRGSLLMTLPPGIQ